MRYYLDDETKLREALRVAPLLEGIGETNVDGYGPSWEFGRIRLAKNYPGFEVLDLPVDLMSDSAFRKIPFDFPADQRRGIAVALSDSREADRVYETIVGWVPVERERELDEWIDVLNGRIRASLAAYEAKWGRPF